MPDKQTKRERKEQAKKQRLEEQRRALKRRRRQKMTSIALIVGTIALVTGGVMWNNARNRAKVEKEDRAVNLLAPAAGCTKVEHPSDAGNTHIEPPATSTYTSDPPTSGSHYNQGPPNGPGFTGVHTSPLQNEVQVHNLEHGHIGIQYETSKIPADVKKALEAFVNKDDDHKQWVFMAPRIGDGFKDTVAFTAWGAVLRCGAGVKADEATKLADAFYDRYQDESPHESGVGTPVPAGGQ